MTSNLERALINHELRMLRSEIVEREVKVGRLQKQLRQLEQAEAGELPRYADGPLYVDGRRVLANG